MELAIASGAHPLIADTPIFKPRERASLETNQYLRPYAAITKAQLARLLSALGEYRALIDFYWRRPATIETASGCQFVFDEPERLTLSLHKYVRGSENLNKRELLGLLEALGRYSLKAPRIEVFGPLTGLVRMIHAHNALVSFRDKAFTQDEFAESVRAVVRGENSRL